MNTELINYFNHISRELAKAKVLHDIQSTLTESLEYILKREFQYSLWHFDKKKGELDAIFSEGYSKKQEKSIQTGSVPDFIKEAFQIKKLKYYNTASKLPSEANNTLLSKTSSMILIPGFYGDECEIILHISNQKENRFNRELQSILSFLTNILAGEFYALKNRIRSFKRLDDYIRSEGFNKAVVEYGADIIIILDPRGIILYHNPSSEKTLGYNHGSLVGQSFFDLVHPKDRKQFKDTFKKSLKVEVIQKIEYQFLCQDGEYKYLESNSINLKDKEGIEGLILDSRDITEKIKTNKELQEQKHFVQQVIDTDPNLIYVKNWEGRFSLINQAVADLHGSTKENVIELLNSQAKAKPEELYNESKKDIETILSGKEIIVEEPFKLPDGEIKWFQTTKKALHTGEGAMQILSISVDITQRKKDAEALLNAQKAKEQFLANMSHEIRTPINGIAGLVNLLVESDPSKEQRKFLSGIQSSTENLKVIINDILDISKIESGKLKFEKIGFMPQSQVISVIETFQYRAMEKGLELSYNIDPKAKTILLGDPVRLNQILTNLVSNAIKFTYSGGIKVNVSVRSSDNKNVNLKFTVNDTGIGIPDDKIEAIFDSFRQADDSVTRRFGGTGLGLAICKQLVELQNGSISVESKEREGTTFTFFIPYEKGKDKDFKKFNARNDSKIKIQDLGSFDKLSVLLVEDNDINQMYSSNILKKWNCEVEIAANGYIALEKLKRNDYDIILMDVQMPVMDGYEATKNIRDHFDPPKRDIPIIALTANAIIGDNDKCLTIGMNDYLSKPFKPEDLFKKITKLTQVSPRPSIPNEEKKQFPINGSKKTQPNYEAIDLSYLSEISNDDIEFMKEMINVFLGSSPQLIANMKAWVKTKDWENIARTAHKLKPSIIFMGINSLKNVVETVEMNCRNKEHIKEVPELIDLIEKTCNKAYQELKSIQLLEVVQ
ncbi:PAS domain S-box protein [Fulvivirgaceae bacterium BMA10]|uniref:histidine kinase n=1 Tax=Splendidivirga corallicola TaxID=3051826 RepID=A0ABT8L167_9BACT|nr:PAS domain S-box protein [Fulvivirgaceae bacterium BMA10]